MDSRMLDGLKDAFCEDCTARMRHAASLVQIDSPLDRTVLDQLHQEFDTLFGGARAVHLPELEQFFRSMARYARHLRNCQSNGRAVEPAAWQDLLAGIHLAQQCGSEQSDCLRLCNIERLRLLQAIENRVDNGDEK
jgi:chemotaxis protein histidine kinase CheA